MVNSTLKIIGVILLLSTSISCNKKLFVDKHLIIEKKRGVMVFIDKESRRLRNMHNGDVFTDSLIPDFFIAHNFTNKVVTKQEIDEVIFSKAEHNISFFYLLRDCNEIDRTSSINIDCLPIYLDNDIDEYLHSNKIYVQAAEIEFIRENLNREYYDLHKSLTIKYKAKFAYLRVNKGSLGILKTRVLEYDWK